MKRNSANRWQNWKALENMVLSPYTSMEGLQTDSSANVRVYAIFKQNTTQFTWSSTKPNFFNHFSCYYQLCDTLGVGTGVDSKFHHNIVVHEKENKIPRKLNWEQLWCSLMFQKSFHVPTHHAYPNEAELFIHWYGSRICLPIQQHTETLLWFWSVLVLFRKCRS